MLHEGFEAWPQTTFSCLVVKHLLLKTAFSQNIASRLLQRLTTSAVFYLEGTSRPSRAAYSEKVGGALPSALMIMVAMTPLWAWILFRVSSTSAYEQRGHLSAPAAPRPLAHRPAPGPPRAPQGRGRRHYHGRAVARERRK